jgi:branched-chain amino acid aminotransferase
MMKVWLDGNLVDKASAKLSVFDHGTLYGDGVFEGIRVYNGRIFQCQAHVDRLFESARRIRLAIPYTKVELTEAMHKTLEANRRINGYIRLVVTRGPGTLGLSPFKCSDPSVFIITSDIEMYPQEMYENGMAMIIAKTIRCPARMLDPQVKSLNYLNNIRAKIEAVEVGVAEAIMLNEQGNVAECTGENIFIVKDGQAVTTRAVVMRLGDKLGIKTAERDISPEDLYAADESFLTGTAAEVIPVTKVDDRIIGNGKVGPVTRKLLVAFQEFTDSNQV